jgi:hypothetical protein
MHPDVLQRVKSEIASVMGTNPHDDEKITYEGLRKLAYLSCVLKEGTVYHVGPLDRC